MATVPISDGDPKDQYTATSSQTIFPYTFWVKDEAHIAVYQNNTLLTLTTHYTVSAILSVTGANIVLVTGATLNDEITIVYDPTFTRTAEYTGTIRLDALNTELTYMLTLLQSNQRKIDDAIRLSDTETVSFTAELPTLTGAGGKILSFNDAGTAFEYKTFSSVDATLDYIGIGEADSDFMVHDGATWVNESAATARTSMDVPGLGAANSFSALNTYTDGVLLNGTVATAAEGLCFGDGDTCFYEQSDDLIRVNIGGAFTWQISSTIWGSNQSNKPHLRNVTGSATVPTVIPNAGDTNTGIGTGTADTVSLIGGGVELLRVENDQHSADGATMFVPNVTSAPSSNPTAGALVYADSGVLKVRQSDGTVATVGASAAVAKAAGYFDGTAGTPALSSALNMTSVTDNGSGDYTLTIDSDLSSIGVVLVSAEAEVGNDTNSNIMMENDTVAVGSFNIFTGTTAGGLLDLEYVSFVVFGDF